MVDKKTQQKFEGFFTRIEEALNQAVANKHYTDAASLALALRRLQLRYGGGIPMCQHESDVLGDVFEDAKVAIQEPIKFEIWDEVAYCSEFLATVEKILIDDCY